MSQPPNTDSCNTPLDKKLQEIAINDWPGFVALIGHDAVNKAKVCLLTKDKKSIRFINKKLRISKGSVENYCKYCPKD